MRSRNATNKEVAAAVFDVWEFCRTKASLTKDTDAWVRSAKNRLDPLKVSKQKIIRETDTLLLKKQEKIVTRPPSRRSSDDQTILDAIDDVWH